MTTLWGFSACGFPTRQHCGAQGFSMFFPWASAAATCPCGLWVLLFEARCRHIGLYFPTSFDILSEERGNPTHSPNRHPQAGALRPGPVNIDPRSDPSLAYLPPSTREVPIHDPATRDHGRGTAQLAHTDKPQQPQTPGGRSRALQLDWAHHTADLSLWG